MTDNQDRVPFEALLRSQPVPNSFAVTFGIDPSYWLNQENGECTDLEPAAGWDDVELVILEELEP